jgi:hypothetical protein
MKLHSAVTTIVGPLLLCIILAVTFFQGMFGLPPSTFSGGGGSGPTADERWGGRSGQRMKELNGLIKEEIGTPSASFASQCKLIGFGAKPCGGPEHYLVYSTMANNTDEPRLKELVSEYNQLQRKINQESGRAGTCNIPSKPDVEVVGEVCVAKCAAYHSCGYGQP